MRRLLAALLALLLPCGAARAQNGPAASSTPVATPGFVSVVGVVSGNVDGTYARIAADLAAVLDSGRLRVLPILGKGSVQNIDDILHTRGVDIGIVQSDVLAFLRQQKPAGPGPNPGSNPGSNPAQSICYIAKLYNEEVHVLAVAGIASLEDLAGRKVNVDVGGSGTALTATTLFNSLGVAATFLHDDQAAALEKLRRGEIDALVYVAGKPTRLFTEVPPGTGLHLLPIRLTEALANSYIPSEFTSQDYPALVPNGAEVDTLAVGAVMAVYNWPRGSDRYAAAARFTDAFFSSIGKLRQPPRHPKWHDVDLRAQVPGWVRFGPAQAWLDHQMPGAGRP